MLQRALIAAIALAPIVASTAAPMPTVLELFTSQGCSSCPPADALLGEMAMRDGVLALAYHVDYWDRLGWQDPFSLAAATARQRAYGRALGLSGIYTPQLVVNGVHDLVGFDRAGLTALLRPSQVGVGILLRAEGGTLAIEIEAAAAQSAEMTLVAYRQRVETLVTRGENAGRRLTDYAIVRAVTPLGRWDGKARSLSIDLTGLPTDCSDVVLLVQSGGVGPMVGAAHLRLR